MKYAIIYFICVISFCACGFITEKVQSQIVKDGYVCTIEGEHEKCWNLVEEKEIRRK